MELELVKNLNKNLDLDNMMEKKALEKVVINVIDKGTDYVLKAMPIQENVKDILIDVKKSLKSKDFSKIVQTAISSSIREGLEIMGAPKEFMQDITTIKDIAFKGGLRQSLIASIEIVTDKYIRGNLLGDTIAKFIDEIKKYINSKSFSSKLDDNIKKLSKKQEKFKVLCSQWYKAYDKLDLVSLNNIAQEIATKHKTSVINSDVLQSSKTILNMTEFVNNKKDKLTPIQLDICKSL